MKKGKVNKNKKNLSVIIVPHNSGNPKILNFSAVYTWLPFLIALLFLILISITYFIIGTISENNSLKYNLLELSSKNQNQENIINEQTETIQDLEIDDLKKRAAINDLYESHREMVDNYITSRSDIEREEDLEEINDTNFLEIHDDFETQFDNIINMDDEWKISLQKNSDTIDNKIDNYSNSIPTFWPTNGNVITGFGYRKDPITFTTRFHYGVDIDAYMGQEIFASGNGKVIFCGWKNGYGKTVIIDHGYKFQSLYAHCTSIVVDSGDNVKKGDLIAKAGSTGRSTGPHLHFEIHFNNETINPLKYLQK